MMMSESDRILRLETLAESTKDRLDELHGDLSQNRAELNTFRTEVNARFDSLNADINTRFDSLRTDMTARFDKQAAEMRTFTRNIYFAGVGLTSALIAAMIATS